MIIYYLLKHISKLLMKILYSFEVTYEGRLPEEPCIFVANHQSLLDPLAIVCSLKRRVIFLASRDLYNIPLLGLLLKSVGTIPIKKNSADIKSIKNALNALKKGYSIAIFPEGGLSVDGELKEAFKGAMYISYKSGSPIVPIGIKGTYNILPIGKYVPKLRGKITVNLGKPVYPDLKSDIKSSTIEMKDTVMDEIRKLLEV